MEKSPNGSTTHKKGQFSFRPNKPKPRGVIPLTNDPSDIIAARAVEVQEGFGSGTTLAELGETPRSQKKDPQKTRYAGTRCQAPRGDGICGAIISYRNPHHKVPFCQPCVKRLGEEAVRNGDRPDPEIIWGRIQRKRKSEQAAQLANRQSGVQEKAQDAKPGLAKAGSRLVA